MFNAIINIPLIRPFMMISQMHHGRGFLKLGKDAAREAAKKLLTGSRTEENIPAASVFTNSGELTADVNSAKGDQQPQLTVDVNPGETKGSQSNLTVDVNSAKEYQSSNGSPSDSDSSPANESPKIPLLENKGDNSYIPDNISTHDTY